MERLYIAISSVAALICAALVFYLMFQINNTRLTLEADGVTEFNFIQQSDHNFDSFAIELMKWQQRALIDPDTPRDFTTRYDILWSMLFMPRAQWTGSLSELPETREMIATSREFIIDIEPLMKPNARIGASDIEYMVKTAKELGTSVYQIGLGLYQAKSALRDDISERMDRLTGAFWFFGASLVVAGITLFSSLTSAYRRVSSLLRESSTAQRQLASALEEVTDGDIERRKQNRFIATASHDLRQPLHALGLNLATLRRHVPSTLGRRILDNASRSTEALNQLLSSVLDVSRLDAAIIEVKRSDLSLDEIFEQLRRTFTPEANERGLALDVSLSNLVVHCDRVLLERILANLVSNALHYTRQGSVSLAATADEQEVVISVKDTGPGIPERERAAIFDEYYQMETPDGTRTAGLGLGLSIVHRLSQLLDVGLSVDSNSDGGTRFDLRLARGSSSMLELPVVQPSAGCRDAIRFDGLTALVIDDDRDVREGMHLLLEEHSCRVMTAESASEARAAIVAEDTIPDLIIADYRLRDDQTGAAAIVEVREEVNEDIPALIVTGDTSPTRLREASASGFRLLNKPVVPDELFAAISELTGRRT